jgi:eukaryotic-like serine/threonine-protein kinase
MSALSVLEELFTQAVALSPPERREFLNGRCGGDSSLRTTLEQLLDAHREAGDFFPEPAEISAPGHSLGPYTLIEEIGRGGFSTVWRAVQERPVRREVAVKRIMPGMDSHQMLRRFEQERQTLALMNHPGIAGIYDAGLDERERPWFVMELVKGATLTKWIAENNPSREERIRLFLEICSAVVHAHQRGVIHRDLKPSNILVGPNGAKIIDFGIARVLADASADSGLTREGQVIGTPAWLAPELMSGEPADTRADVFSLGVILCEMLTGRLPRDPDIFRKLPSGSWRQAIDSTPARWTFLKNDLDAILARALETDPNRRYGSVAELSADVEAFQGGRPVKARKPTRFYLFRRFVGRHRVSVAAACIALLGILTGTVVAWKEKAAADRARQHAEDEARHAEEALAVLQQLIVASDPEAGNPAALTVSELVDRFAKQLPAESLANPRIELGLRFAIGMSLRGRGRLAEGGEQLLRARDLALAVFGPDHDQTGQIQLGLAVIFFMLERNQDALECAREARRVLQKTRGTSAIDTLRAREVTINSLISLGFPKEGEAEARSLQADAAAANSIVAPRTFWLLGRALLKQKRFDEAVDAARSYVKAQIEKAGPDSLVAWDAERFLGEALYNQGNYAESIAVLREAMEKQRGHFGPDHPTVRDTMDELMRSEKAAAAASPK